MMLNTTDLFNKLQTYPSPSLHIISKTSSGCLVKLSSDNFFNSLKIKQNTKIRQNLYLYVNLKIKAKEQFKLITKELTDFTNAVPVPITTFTSKHMKATTAAFNYFLNTAEK